MKWFTIFHKIFFLKAYSMYSYGQNVSFLFHKTYHIGLQKFKTRHMFECKLLLFHKKLTFFKQLVVLDGMALTANYNVLDTVKTTLPVTTWVAAVMAVLLDGPAHFVTKVNILHSKSINVANKMIRNVCNNQCGITFLNGF